MTANRLWGSQLQCWDTTENTVKYTFILFSYIYLPYIHKTWFVDEPDVDLISLFIFEGSIISEVIWMNTVNTVQGEKKDLESIHSLSVCSKTVKASKKKKM